MSIRDSEIPCCFDRDYMKEILQESAGKCFETRGPIDFHVV